MVFYGDWHTDGDLLEATFDDTRVIQRRNSTLANTGKVDRGGQPRALRGAEHYREGALRIDTVP